MRLKQENHDPEVVSVTRSLEVITEYLSDMADMLTLMATQGVEKAKARSAHVMDDNDNRINEYLGVEDGEKSGAFVVGRKEYDDRQPKKPWWREGFRFPCEIEGYFDQEVVTCMQFFKMPPKDRQEKTKT